MVQNQTFEKQILVVDPLSPIKSIKFMHAANAEPLVDDFGLHLQLNRKHVFATLPITVVRIQI